MKYQINRVYGNNATEVFEKIINQKYEDGWKLHSWSFREGTTEITYVLEKIQCTNVKTNVEQSVAGNG